MGAVLFDLDGTLVITHIDFPAMRVAVEAVALAAGMQREALVGVDILGIARRAVEHARAAGGEEAARVVAAQAEEAMIAAELRGLEGAGPAPFAIEVLQALADAEIRVGIVTRNCRRATDAVLAMAGIASPVILTRDDVPRCKPDPGHLLAALERLGVPPAAAVMVGDHPMDVAGGRAAGMRTVGVRLAGRPADTFDAARPDLVIDDLRGLLPFVFGGK